MTNEIEDDAPMTTGYGTPPTSTSTKAVSQARKEKKVIDFAEIANQRKISGEYHPDTDDDMERSRSNISGMNHDSDSARHASGSSMHLDTKKLAEWPVSARQDKKPALFKEELEQDGGEEMVFEGGNAGSAEKGPKPLDQDSQVSTAYSPSQIMKKAALEQIWQKANSINGIRKLNMNFKDERRQVEPLDADGYITADYWQVCEQFLQMLDIKQSENLKQLIREYEDPGRITESIKSEINNYQHMAIGLGRRFQVPEDIDVNKAVKLQRQLMDRVIAIYGANSRDFEGDVVRLQKMCQCVADDEFYKQTGYEPEQIEVFLWQNKLKVRDLRERTVSYDYLQKNDSDSESQQSGSSRQSEVDDLVGQMDDFATKRKEVKESLIVQRDTVQAINASYHMSQIA